MERVPLWRPSGEMIKNSNLSGFQNWLAERGNYFASYEELWNWSTTDLDGFWRAIVDYFDVQYDGSVQQVVSGTMPDCVWMEGISLSYAEHVFRQFSHEHPALIAVTEDGTETRVSWQELQRQTACLQTWLRANNIQKGDRIAAVLPNQPVATVSFLATNACGAIWSCCSPDFGTASIIDRFAQIEPRVLIVTADYRYNGKKFDRLTVAHELKAQLPSVEHVILLAEASVSGFVSWDAIMQASQSSNLDFVRVPFNHPIWILYSSGTTGLPKAITHCTGGILLEQLKYNTFHNDVKPGERFLWYTTTGWMMWNYLQGTLLVGATAILYDGSPAFPDLGRLWQLAAELQLHHFGTSAGFLLANRKAAGDYRQLDWSRLRSISSTGSTLPPEGFEWVYEHVKKDIWLVSMSGGTDVCSAFIGGNPWVAVYAGEIQCRALGCRLEAWNEAGQPIEESMGEMVITQPMPSMPIFFWNDPDKKRYRESYFDHYPGVWRHGDWIEISASSGIIVYGRSDATLNRGGVRIGTSEVYRAVEGVHEIQDSLIVCIEKTTGEFYMPLFVMMRPGHVLDEKIKQQVVQNLRTRYSPRHVPDEILAVPDIPYTISGKKTELPVKKILSGKSVASSLQTGSLRNPGSLQYFQDLYDQQENS
jgi:acetoacetyl-CoA synthetase